MLNGKSKEKGWVQIVVIFVILVLLASAFKVNLRGYVDSTPEQALDSNVVMIIQTGKIVWSDYIYPPIETVWSGYVVPFFKGEWLGGLKQKVEQQRTLPPG